MTDEPETAATAEEEAPEVEAPPVEEVAPPAKPKKKKDLPVEEEVAPQPALPPCALPPVAASGDEGPQVAALQNWLARAGFLTSRDLLLGTVHRGTYDTPTTVAVQQAQRRSRPRYTGPIHGQWDEATRLAACASLT